MHIHCLQTTGDAKQNETLTQLKSDGGATFLMLFQDYPIIGSSSRICWQVTMCARVDTGKENQDKGKGKHNMTILI